MAKSTWFASLLDYNAGHNVWVDTPFGFRILNLFGTARITTTSQTTIPVYLRYQSLIKTDEPMIIPKDSYVVAARWRIPALSVGGVSNSTTHTVKGTSGERLKLAPAKDNASTSATGVATTIPIGGLSVPFGSNGFIPLADANKTYGKWRNPYESPSSDGLGLYTATSDSDRTVNIYSVTGAGTAVGGGVSCTTTNPQFGFPDTIDIPVQITIIDAPELLTEYDYGVVIN